MSAAPTDCRVPDPSDKLDAKADGQFQAVNRRAGYGDDRLDRIIATARKGWTLAAGEGLVLVQEIDRLRSILAALREPNEEVVQAVKDAIYEELGIEYWDGKTRRLLYYAVAAAEREVTNDR